MTILKAALNHAYSEGKIPSDTAWRRVKAFRGANSARVGYATEDQATRLLNACEGASASSCVAPWKRAADTAS